MTDSEVVTPPNLPIPNPHPPILDPHSPIITNTLSPYLNLHDLTNPFRLDHGDNQAITLVADLLTTDNYPTWSRAMQAKNKLGFISSSLPKPTAPNDPLLDLWDRCNDMVGSWIQNSICPSLKSSIIFVDDACEIWLDLQERFSHQNGPRIFQLKKALASLSQEGDSVSIYYGNLKTFWDELAIYDPILVCTCGTVKTLFDKSQWECVLQFLMGLNDYYSPIRDPIMLIDPLPPVLKVFALVQQQELHHQITSHSHSSETIALAIIKPYSPTKFLSKNQSKKDRPYCTHCKILGHTMENCFKLGNAKPPLCTHCNMTGHSVDKCYKFNGYPSGHKFDNKQPHVSHANQSSLSMANDSEGVGDDKVALTKLQYQQLLSLLQPQAPISATVLHSTSSTRSSHQPVSS